MARARNIKPAFFTSEQIADQCPLGRLLFIGLWTLADYKGDLEWKPRTIKVQVLPFDDCDIEKLAINLDKSGLIRFYSDGNSVFVNIPKFTEHQNPHKNEREKGSSIPNYSETMRQAIDLKGLTINRDKSRSKRSTNGSDPADSLNLNPDSLNGSSGRFAPPTLDQAFEYFKERGCNDKAQAERFIDFYESKGWMVGKSKMKDWQASVRNWLQGYKPAQEKHAGLDF